MSEVLIANAPLWRPGVTYLPGSIVNVGYDAYRALVATTSHPCQATGDWRQLNWRPS